MTKKYKKNIIITVIFLFICFTIIIAIINLNKKDELFGLWNVDDNTKYEFDGKGNGQIIVPNATYKFTYEINDNIVSVDFKSKKSTDTKYKYKVSKQKLELYDLNQQGVNLELKRINK